jgi:uncharacterized protein with NRDE domain
LASLRAERRSRLSRAPGRHWVDRPEVVGGLDLVEEGAWQGVNAQGLVASVINRDAGLGPHPGLRSRGELVLEALDHAEAEAAAGALADLQPRAYAPFNLVIADPRRAYWLRHDGAGEIRVHPISDGLHLIAGGELDDLAHPVLGQWLARLRDLPTPAFEADASLEAFSDWIGLMQAIAARAREDSESEDPDSEARDNEARDRDGRDGGDLASAHLAAQKGHDQDADPVEQLSASLIAIPAYPGFEQRPRWWYAEGHPARAAFAEVAL